MPLLKLILALGCVGFGILVSALNGDPVSVDLLVVQIELPLGQVLLFSLFIGALVGGLAVALTRLLERRKPMAAGANGGVA